MVPVVPLKFADVVGQEEYSPYKYHNGRSLSCVSHTFSMDWLCVLSTQKKHTQEEKNTCTVVELKTFRNLQS